MVVPPLPPPPPPPATQVPAVSNEVLALAQHAHAAQPGTNSAEAEQQQPPAQRLVPQSAAEAQGSPGGCSAHAPVKGVQVEQLARRLGACKLTLEVLSGNRQAMGLYERCGFAPYTLDATMGQAQFLQKWL